MARRPPSSVKNEQPAVTAAPAQAAAQETNIMPQTVDTGLLQRLIDATEGNAFLYVNPANAEFMRAQGLTDVNPDIHNENGEVATRAMVPAARAYIANATPPAGAWQTGPAQQQTQAQPQAQTSAPSAPATTRKPFEKSNETFEIDEDVPMPEVARRGRESSTQYPFDTLTKVGASFHVPKTADRPEPVKTVSSTVSNYNRKHAYDLRDVNGQLIMEDQSYNEAIKDVNGNPVLDANGKKVYRHVEATGPKQGYTKFFKVFPVGPKDPRGEGARVFRTI